MIAVISYFDSNPEPLNCESVVAENTATSRDGFYFVPLNKDDVPLGTQIILKEEPIEGLKKYLSNKNFLGIGPKNADNIVVIDNGKIIESGKHEILLNNKNVYSDLWNVQVGI